MAQVHQILITNFTNTGQTTPFPRVSFDVSVDYTDNAGVRQTHGPLQRVFPNVISTMPNGARKRFAIDMVTAYIRVEVLGIDTWEMYE